MIFTSLQNRVIELCIKFNQTDLLNDLQYLSEQQWLGAYYMLKRLQGA
jgi:hypothetical protein